MVPVTTNQWLETPSGNPTCGCPRQIRSFRSFRSSTPGYPLSGWRISHELSHFDAKISTSIKILIGYASELSPQSGLFQPFVSICDLSECVLEGNHQPNGSKTSASLDFNAFKLGQTYNFIVLGSHAPLYPYTIIPYIDNCLDNNGN